MSVSRIDKMIFETSGVTSLLESTERRNVTFQIVVGDDTTTKSAMLAHAAVSIALRSLTGPIHLYIGNAIGLRELSLAEELLEVERLYDSSRRVKVMEGEPDQTITTIRLGSAKGAGLLADAAGWVAGINKMMSPNAMAEAPAACFAVACVFAKIFKEVVLGKPISQESWSFDLFNLVLNPTGGDAHVSLPVDFGDLGLLGAGALGSSFSFVLSLTNWKGRVDIIDFDKYEEPNHETTLLIGRRDVLQSPKKAERLSEVLNRHASIAASPHTVRVDHKSPELIVTRDIFVCVVDNSETRRILDHVNAGVLLNSGVGGTAYDAGHVLTTRHGPDDLMLSAYYTDDEGNVIRASDKDQIPVEFQDECSRLNYRSVSLAAPFIALASGALLAAACAREACKVRNPVNYVKIDLFGYQQAMDIRRPQRMISQCVEALQAVP